MVCVHHGIYGYEVTLLKIPVHLVGFKELIASVVGTYYKAVCCQGFEEISAVIGIIFCVHDIGEVARRH